MLTLVSSCISLGCLLPFLGLLLPLLLLLLLLLKPLPQFLHFQRSGSKVRSQFLLFMNFLGQLLFKTFLIPY
ncbi:hypothetical protein CALCODRAFT_153889 [Calocera cornea HHB12733]|uniref:Uncharacterized protein n=1 Tax=Calocera cornea HHB12733 TaxID=1353952 RepID=A0A165CM12_9BASI|nr:hypothetical protein CALCODRAFT_153889 [Calocera cornea HHB12733]